LLLDLCHTTFLLFVFGCWRLFGSHLCYLSAMLIDFHSPVYISPIHSSLHLVILFGLHLISSLLLTLDTLFRSAFLSCPQFSCLIFGELHHHPGLGVLAAICLATWARLKLKISGGWSVDERDIHPRDVGGEKRHSILVLIETITTHMMHSGICLTPHIRLVDSEYSNQRFRETNS
jgi:hypothetical protein